MLNHLRLAFTSLKRNRVRTALTTLGIVIGVASLTLVLALTEGAKQTLLNQVSDLNGNIVLVKPGSAEMNQEAVYNPYNTAITSSLTKEDLQSISELPNVEAAAPLMILNGSTKFEDKTISTPIIATNNKLPTILDVELESGDFIDTNTTGQSVVLGHDLAVELLGTISAGGQQVTIKGQRYTVIGVLSDLNRPINITGVNLDHAAFVSLDDGQNFTNGVIQLQQLNLKLADKSKLSASVKQVRQTIAKNHNDQQDFAVLGGKNIASFGDRTFYVISAVTSLVAFITLLVGGIGIMNIMLVTVSERTREIGIRKAVGATDIHVFNQLLIESLLISISGGIIGVLAALGLDFIVAAQLSIAPVINLYVIGTGLTAAIVIGVFFGLYPALKASRQDPIRALRQYH